VTAFRGRKACGGIEGQTVWKQGERAE